MCEVPWNISTLAKRRDQSNLESTGSLRFPRFSTQFLVPSITDVLSPQEQNTKVLSSEFNYCR